jgi:outer membrane immunogenic protein
MKKILFGGAALFLLGASAATATDMPMKAPAPRAAAPFSWDGVYVGAHVGYGWGDFTFNESNGFGSSKTHPSGWLGGGQIGYNYQFAPNWVLGGEIDFSWADIHDSGSFSAAAATANGKIDFLGTARTRIGYVIQRTMLYATGGFAWASTKSSEFAGAAPIRSFDRSHNGWTIGAGIEQALDSNWSVKVEYLYADLGRNRDIFVGAAAPELNQDLKVSTVKLGVNYRFGAPAVYAANMPVKAYAPKSDPWSGSYIGAHGGYGWSDEKFQLGTTVWTPDPKGFFGGIQSGYNWRFAPNWLFGIETDTSFGSLTGNDNSVPGATTRGKIDTFGTARGRLGYVADRSLWYVTGGAAVADVKTVQSTLPVGQDERALHAGWTVGGGVEYMIDPMWSAKIEYLYADLGRNKENLSPFSTDVTLNAVKFGVNYHGPLLERLFTGR